jgi:thiamine biosynthesis lipoprotein
MMKCFATALLFSVLLLYIPTKGQVVTDFRDAFHIANEKQRPVLIIFAGSDWCAPCIHFNKKVYTEKEFQDFLLQHLIVYEADFPQRKKLSKNIQLQNEALAERYNPKGAFPYFVLVRPDQSVITTLAYDNESPQTFIRKVSAHLEDEQAKNVQKTN